jgi:hypothetical protein
MWFLLAHRAVAAPIPVADATGLATALAAARPGDVLELAAGDYVGRFDVPAGVRLRGAAGAAGTVLHEDGGTVLNLRSDPGVTLPTVLEGLTVVGDPYVNGSGNLAGGLPVVVRHETEIRDCVLGPGVADRGGSVYVADAVPVRIERSLLQGSVAREYGGHVYFQVPGASLEVVDSTLERGTSWIHGGAVHAVGVALRVERSAIQGNTASGSGGGLFLDGCDTQLASTTLASNEAPNGNGGGLWAVTGTLDLDDTTWTGNTAEEGGGAYLSSLLTTVSGSTFDGNRAEQGRGGAVRASGLPALTITDTAFTGNAGFEGGALGIGASPFGIVRSRFCDNFLLDDEEPGVGSRGGAVLLDSSAGSVANSLFLQDWSAEGDGSGAGLAVVGATSRVDVHQDVFAHGFTATTGAALAAFDGAAVDVRNSLVAWNTGAATVFEAIAPKPALVVAFDAFYGNVGTPTDPASLLDGEGNLIEVDPGLGPVDDASCDLAAWRPLPGSALIDAGNPAITDPDGTRSDIGPFGGPESPDPLDADRDGVPDDLDCAPADPAVFPGAPETCNGIDDDCDELVDVADPDCAGIEALAPDADGDGFAPTDAVFVDVCPADGLVAEGGDCDDSDARAHPGAEDDAGPADLDCDGVGDVAGPLRRDCACDAGAPGLGAWVGLVAVAARSLSARRRSRAAGRRSR